MEVLQVAQAVGCRHNVNIKVNASFQSAALPRATTVLHRPQQRVPSLKRKCVSSPRPALVVRAGSSQNGPASSSDNLQVAYAGGDAAVLTATPLEAEQPVENRPDFERLEWLEAWIERRIFNCRFLTLFAVVGSLVGAFLCFFKGSLIVVEAVKVFCASCWRNLGPGRVILLLVEALDVYLIGTVMLIFGMGLYELFVDTLDVPVKPGDRLFVHGRSSLFGLFPLRERPKWLEIHSLDEMKAKLGHVIVMILLVGMFEKSKKVVIHSAQDLFLFSASVAACAGCLFLLSKLKD